MPSMTIALSNSLLNAVLRQTTYTSPAGAYLAVYTTAPNASGGGTEVTGGSYFRPSVTFSSPTSGSTANSNQLDITSMPAVTVVGMAVMSASSGGVMLFYGSLLNPKQVNAGDTFTVKAGDLNVALI